MIGNQQPKEIKKEPEDDAQSVTQDEPKVETIVKPWEDKKDYEAIFRKYISIGDDGEEQYDVIDMEREAQMLHPTCDGRETMHDGCETFASLPLDGQTREGANAHKPRCIPMCVRALQPQGPIKNPSVTHFVFLKAHHFH